MKHDEAISAALANRRFMYTYLWRAFATDPDKAFLDSVCSDTTLAECALFMGEDSQGMREQDLLVNFVRATPDVLDVVKRDYTKLFIGPAKLPAPPWESVYVTGEDLLFQVSTLEVRQAFHSAGYQATGYPHEADDHLATELGFMEALAKKTLDAYEGGDSEQVKLLLSHQVRFLSEHLNAWLPQFVERLLSSDKPKVSDFYHRFAVLTREMCAVDSMALEEIAVALA